MGNKVSELLASPESEEKARKAFKLMDRNNDDMLDRSEWKEFGMLLLKRDEHHKESTPSAKALALNPEAVETFVEQMFLAADSNRDGLVSFDEFYTYVRSRKLTTSTDNLHATFKDPPTSSHTRSSSSTGSPSLARHSSSALTLQVTPPQQRNTLNPSTPEGSSSAPGTPSGLADRASRMARAKRPSVHNFRPTPVSVRSTIDDSIPEHEIGLLSAREYSSAPLSSLNYPLGDSSSSESPLSARSPTVYAPIEGLVWDEEIKVDAGVRPIPKAGTLERLVEELTPTGDSNLQFMHYFLITYRSFTNPSELVQLLIQRFRQSSANQTASEEQQKMILQRRVLRFVKKWVDEAFYDFNQSSSSEMIAFLYSDVKGPYRPVFDSIMKVIREQSEKLPSHHFVFQTPEPTTPISSEKKHERNKSEGHMEKNEIKAPSSGSTSQIAVEKAADSSQTKTRSSRTLSRSVTYDPSTSTASAKSRETASPGSAPVSPVTPKPAIVAPEGDGGSAAEPDRDRKSRRVSRHSRNFSPAKSIISNATSNGQIDWKKVDVKELAIQMTLADFASLRTIHYSELLFWLKAKLKPQAPHVQQFIDRFNKLGSWVATQIVSCPQIKYRIRLVSSLIQLAKALEHLNNFNGVMAVLGGLSSTAVHRLKFTFEGLPEEDKATLTSLSNLMDNHSSFANYRKRWVDARGCRIPYLGVIIQDLLFVDEGSADVTTDGLVNFRKRRRMAAYLEELQHVQNYPYAHTQVPDLFEICQKLEPQLGEKEQYNESLLREPRQATLKDVL